MPDLAEAKYSADQLRSMLDKGTALKNDQGEPSYPIADVEDLRKAIAAVGRGGTSHNKIRAYIIKRAKALGKSDMIPDDWSSTGTKSEASVPEHATVSESGSIAEATGVQGRRRRIQLIDAGWSKNGRYYGPNTLAEAAHAKIYPAGTPMFIDHPTLSEQEERPERSVKDLAARLVSDARFENGALVAEADLFGPWRPVINEMAEHIGVSIRAAGTLEYGEAEGRQGPIVTALTEGISVDFVTSPARGGKILELVESVRAMPLSESRSIGAWLESRLHLSFTSMADDMYGEGRLTREERIALSSAIGEALASFVSKVEDEHPQLYQRDLWQSPTADDAAVSEAATEPEGQIELQLQPLTVGKDVETWLIESLDNLRGKKAKPGDAPKLAPPFKSKSDKDKDEEDEDAKASAKKTGTAEADRTQNAPGSPPADTPPTLEEGAMPELNEAEARKLQESVDAALAEAETARNEAAAATAERAAADLRLARFEATESARSIAASLVAESDLKPASQGRLIGDLVQSAKVPLTGDSRLDESAFRATVADAIQKERVYVATIFEESGAGTPSNLGESTSPTDTDPTAAAAVTEALVESYRQSGMTEGAARLAAAGRRF